MAENMKIDRSKTDDGRRVEQRVFETVVDGVKERVVETHVEQIPMTLQERVVEKVAPVVTARKREVYKEGKLVDTIVEELDGGSTKLQPVMNPQIIPNALTKEDLVAALREVVSTQPREVAKPMELDEEEARPVFKKKKKVFKAEAPVAPTPAPVPLVSAPATPVQNKTWDTIEMVAWVVLSGELAFCAYHLFLKNFL